MESRAQHWALIRCEVVAVIAWAMNSEDLPRLHGIDERVGVAAYGDMIRFYRQLLKEAQPDS